jgi:hypothetical protein
MMDARKILPLLALAAMILILALPAHGQTGIIVNRADAIRQQDVRLDGGLSSVTRNAGPRIVLDYVNTARHERIVIPPAALQTLFARVPPRVVLDFANTARHERVAMPPSALQTLFAQVTPRVVLDYANTARHERIVAPPTGLQTLFGQVAPRIILQYANTSRQMTLVYPRALIGDTAAPRISNVQTQSVGGGVKITWTTDEFATSEVRYGTAPGAYTQTASDPLYEKTHSLTLTGLRPGTRYYFVVAGADLGGNRGQSGEYQVRVEAKVYLPVARRGLPRPTPTPAPTVHPDVCQRYEPNNTLSTAWGPLPRNQAIQAALCSGDPDDYYYLDLAAAATLSLDLTNLPAGTDYELVLYNAGGGQLADSRNGGTTPERIVRTLAAGRYYVRVYPYSGRSSQPYRLIASWGTAAQATEPAADTAWDKPPLPAPQQVGP